MPLTDTALIQIDHWTNLYAANLGLILVDLARLRKAPRTRLLSLALRARSVDKWRVLRQATRIGHHCDIHPTAYVEGSTIGDDVTIGAGTVIRESLIGAGTSIANNATVELSVIGEGCTIFNGCVVQVSVLYPGACTSCRYVGMHLAGRDTFISDGVTLADFRFDGRCVQVLKDGVRVDTGMPILGTCLGHRAYLGAGCVLAPGRAVPNDWHLVPDRQRVLAAFPEDGVVVGHRVLGTAMRRARVAGRA
jgi:NDP-sugar pyrophosphorylase family protein